RPDVDARAERVLDEDAAVAVEYEPALRVDRERTHAVVVCLRQILVAREHLEGPEPQEEHREHRQRDEAEHGDAQGELRRQAVRLLDARIARQETAAARLLLPATQGGAPRTRGR